jgi:hypothetical protein
VYTPGTGFTTSWDVSTDGTEFTWINGAGIHFNAYECDLNGRNYKRNDMGASSALWMPNSKQWIEHVFDRIRIHSVTGAAGQRPLPMELSLNENSPLRRDTEPLGLEAALIRSDYHVWIPELLPRYWNHPSTRISDKLSILDLDLQHGGKTVRTWNIPLSLRAVLREARISPDGKQVAMTLTTHQSSSFGRLMKKLFRSYPDNVTTAGLWVANMDGTGMHCLGTVPPLPDPNSTVYPVDPRWLPDSKRISYLYGNGIYIIPAN